MRELWLQLARNIEFTVDRSGAEVCNQDELIAFETEQLIRLPEEYKEFCQIFGSGEVGSFFRIFCPSHFLLRAQEILSKMENKVRSNQIQNEDFQQKIGILSNAFVFGDDFGNYVLAWDLRTYSESDKNYDIYMLYWEEPEINDFILVGRSFFDFVKSFCYGSKASELMPHLYNLDEVENTFIQFTPH